MAATNVLDKDSLQIVHGPVFRDRVDWFLRQHHRFGNTAVRVASDGLLKMYAKRFCQSHVEEFFPNIRISGVPDAHHVYLEVLSIYRNLRADLLNQARLKRSIPTPVQSQPTVLETTEVERSSVDAIVQVNIPKSFRSKRRKRRQNDTKEKHSNGVSPCVEPSKINTMETLTSEIATETESSTNDTLSFDDLLLSSQGSTSSSVSTALSTSSRPSVFKKVTPSQFAEQMIKIKENVRQLQADDSRLQATNQTLTDYRKFVENTLCICQDTYLHEAQSAKMASIYQRAVSCEVVVDALRDILTDINFKYFSDHLLLHGHAPPARYWLDGTRKLRQNVQDMYL